MANVIRIKRSTVPGKVPLAGDLEVGELAVNTADGALYTKHNDSTVKQISANLATVTLDYVATNGNTTSRALTFTNNTVSSSSNTGAVVVTGGLGVGGDLRSGGSVYAEGYFYAGNLQPVGGAITELAPANITNSNVIVSTANVATLIDSVSITGINSVKWSIVAVDAVNNYFKSSQIDSVNDGSDVYYTEFGVVLSNSEHEVVTFTSNIANGNVRLYGVVESANTAITFQRTTLGSATVSGAATAQTLSAQRGYTGSQGSQGSIGYTGSAGASVIGFSGSTGGGAIGGNLYVPGTTTISGNIIPSANVTYSLGSSDYRFKDLWLSGNTIYLGNTTFSSNSVLPFNLAIAPEVLTIQVDATEPGDDVRWFWTWETSTLPYARTQITNSPQISVPLYKQGTYTINNFAANQLHGNLTQVHEGYFKWIEGAGTQNLVSWAVDNGNVNVSHPDINSGNVTSVQRYTVSVPASITLPTLVNHTANYTVSFANAGSYSISGDADGYNKTLGPMYRGGTYTFTLDSTLANHPFYLTTDNGTNFVSNSYIGEYTTGVTGTRGNGQAGYNTLTFVVPNNAPDTLYYQCGVHSSMRGAIRIKNLAVDTNVNGNYVIYFQHTHEGHATPIEIRPIPALVNQMCLVYDATVGQFVPQDMATYVENTPSFRNKIQEVAGTATLIAPDGIPVVPTVSIVEDASYLPFVNNKDGDISYTEDTKTLYVWDNGTWNSTKANVAAGYTGSAGAGYTGSASTVAGYTGSAGAGYTGSASTVPGYTGSAGIVGYTGSAGTGGGSGTQTKIVDYSGTLAVFNGTKRWWINTTYTITKLLAFLTTGPTGANLNIRVNKNGSSAATFSVTAGTSSAESVVSIAVVKGDYITVDITQIGSTVAGADLSVIFEYS